MERDGRVLRIVGEIDQANAPAITARIIVETGAGVDRLDVSQVEYCGAAGLRALLAGRADLRKHHATLHLMCSPVVLRILDVCGLRTAEGLVVVPADQDGGGS